MSTRFVIIGDDGCELDSHILLEAGAVTMLSRVGTAGTPSSQNQDYSRACALSSEGFVLAAGE